MVVSRLLRFRATNREFGRLIRTDRYAAVVASGLFDILLPSVEGDEEDDVVGYLGALAVFGFLFEAARIGVEYGTVGVDRDLADCPVFDEPELLAAVDERVKMRRFEDDVLFQRVVQVTASLFTEVSSPVSATDRRCAALRGCVVARLSLEGR